MSIVPYLKDNSYFSSPLHPARAQPTEHPLDPHNDLVPPAMVPSINPQPNGSLPSNFQRRYFSINTKDINKYHKEKLKKWIRVYEKVLGTCYRRIREHVIHDQFFCFYQVPEFIPGYPVFNMTECTFFLLRKLGQSGFTVNYIPPNVIHIRWPRPAECKAIQPPPVPAPRTLPPPIYTRPDTRTGNAGLITADPRPAPESISSNTFNSTIAPNAGSDRAVTYGKNMEEQFLFR